MDPMAITKTPDFPRGDELQNIISRANELRAQESGRILRRWLGLDRRPKPATETAPSTMENPLPHQG